MTLWSKLLIVAAGLPGLAAASDPEMINLVMPDANMVVEFNIARILASPIGSALREGMQQGFTQSLNAEMTKAKPEFQEQIAALTSIAWSRDVQDVVIAGETGKTSSALLIIRTSLDPDRIQALKAFTGHVTEYGGVSILTSDKPGNGAIAFLENSIVVIGQMNAVKSAIDRRGQRTVLPAALAAQIARYSGYDIWAAETGTFPPVAGPATKSAAGAKMMEYFAKVAGLHGGLRLSPDFDLSADIDARTEKDAAEMADGLR
jgi:hypothetical protein